MSDMEKQEYKSKWDELAREIGAEIPPETEQREEATAAAPAQSHVEQEPVRSAPVAPPPPKKSPANWDMLAGELGLPPIEPPAPPKVEEVRPIPEAGESSRDIAEPKRRERPDRPQRRDSREQRPERQEQRREPPKQNRERSEPRRERPERQRERPDTRRERPQSRRPPRELADDVSIDETTRAPAEQLPPAPPVERRPTSSQQREEPPKPPAVSLWHKIFGLPPEQTAKLSERSPTGDDEEDARTQEERPFGAGDSWSSVNVTSEEVTTDSIEEEIVQGDDDARATEEGDSPDRSRGRRRRRGGRGRKSSERTTEGPRRAPRQPVSRSADEINEDTDVDDDDDDDLTLDDPALLSTDDDSDTEDADDGDMAAAGSVRGRSAAQRAIPSWDEAIGYIVDANMQSRPQRRGSARPDSRPNSSRGRTRGRRSR